MIGKEIREKREKLGLSKYELAKRVGVSWNTVHLWEKGVWSVSERNLERLRQVLSNGQRDS